MKRLFIALLTASLAAFSNAFSQWPNYSSQIEDSFAEYDTGLLVAGCVVAGAGIITALAISNPDAEFTLSSEELPARSARLRAFPKALKLTREDDCSYGTVVSVEPASFALATRIDTARVLFNGNYHIVDLQSAARRSRTGKTKWLIAAGGAGLGIILIAASETDPKSGPGISDASGTAKTLLYLAGASLIIGGTIPALIKSADEEELELWESRKELDPQGTSTGGIMKPQFNFLLRPLATIQQPGRVTTELVPTIQMRFGL